jgi:hypothetical protein
VLEPYTLKGTGLENLGTPPPNLTEEASPPGNVSPSLGGTDEDGSSPPAQQDKLNYWNSARPLLVRRTSSPMTVMFSSRPTIRLVLPGIAPPD